MTLRLSEDQVARLLPSTDEQLLFQGCHPDTRCYAFYSILSTPQVNGSAETGNPYYEAQLDFNWPINCPEDDDVVPETSAERLAKIKRFATAGTGFYQPLRDIVLSIPQDTQVLPVALADWPTVPWPNLDGRVTLLGDAAHPMAMCECLVCVCECLTLRLMIKICTFVQPD